MGKKKTLNEFRVSSGYGWTDSSVAGFTRKMQEASVKIELLQETYKFQALACRGSSGMMAASVLGIALQLPVIYVRKEEEFSHGSSVESNAGYRTLERYLIVDDLICTGNTLAKIADKIENYAKRNSMKPPVCVGAFLYADNYAKGFNKTVGNRTFRIFV